MKEYDAILLLGMELNAEDQPTQELIIRAEAAAKAYMQKLSQKVVVCGGILPGHAACEADVMAALLEERGVPGDRIIMENQSQDTMENLRFAAKLLGGAKGKRVLVVTSDYHLRRAVMTARRAGFKAKGLAAVLKHDGEWRGKRNKELAYTLDLIMGWQDEGKHRPEWTYALFDIAFGKGCKKT